MKFEYFNKKRIRLYQGECLEVMDKLIKKGIKFDAIITDPPYQITACRWDRIIPFDKMWSRLKQLRNDNTPIVLFGSEPFSSALRMSNIKEYKYDWVWQKSRPTGFFTVKKMPMKIHENILVFYKKAPIYNPIMTKADESKIDKRKTFNPTFSPYLGVSKERVKDSGSRYPLTVQLFSSISQKGQHPTQKPIKLMEYFVLTYTNKNDKVLDFTIGSGTTALACQNLNRKCIGIELDKKYFKIACKRLKENG